MDWQIFFKNLKDKKFKEFKSPSFLIKPKNRFKKEYIYKKPFVFTKFFLNKNGLKVTDGSFERYLEPDSFISFSYKEYYDRSSKFKLIIESTVTIDCE